MKKLVVLMLCLVLALGSAVNVHALGMFDDAVDYELGTQISGFIAADDKQNSYKIELPAAGGLSISCIAAIDKMALKIFDVDEVELWRNIPKADENGQINITDKTYLTAGTYYLYVSQAYKGGFGDYAITMNLEAAKEDFPETYKDNNNSMADADEIVLNKVYTGFLAPNDQYDMYKLSLGGNARVVVASQSSSIDIGYYTESGSNKWHKTYSWNSEKRKTEIVFDRNMESGTWGFRLSFPTGVQSASMSGEYAFYITNGVGTIEGLEKMDQIQPIHTPSASTAPAEPEKPATPVKPQTITVKVDGKAVEFDQPPVLENDRTLVPLRAIFEALGATVEWEDATQTVKASKGDIAISLQIGSKDMFVNGTTKVLDVPAKLLNSRTLVPVRAISEAFGCKVDWEDATQTVIITQ